MPSTLTTLGETFDTIIDSGLFHIFDDAARSSNVTALHAALRPGATFHLMCFSDRHPATSVPRRVTEGEFARHVRLRTGGSTPSSPTASTSTRASALHRGSLAARTSSDWRPGRSTAGTNGEGPPGRRPSLPVTSFRGGRASSGPVDEHVGERAGWWSGQVDASQIHDLATDQMVKSSSEVASSVNDFSMSGASNHTTIKLPIGVSCKSPSPRASPVLAACASNPVRRSPMHAAAKSFLLALCREGCG